MKNKLLSIVTGIIILLLSCSTTQTVRVCNDEHFCGVGLYNESGQIITSAHNVISLKEELDLAVLEYNGTKYPVVYCQGKSGDIVTVVTKPFTKKSVCYRAKIKYSTTEYYYIEGYVANYGDSGSPVVRLEGNCIIGLINSRIEHDNMSRVSKLVVD